MNVWTKRLIGLLILLVIGLVIFDNWFTPDVPPALQQDISLEVDGESQTITPPPTAPTATPPRETAPPSQPAFTLESLDEDNSGPQPVLSNPGSDKAKAREAAQIAANQKTVAKNTTPPAADSPPAAAPPPEKNKPRKGGSWVQAGAFSSQENADNLMAQLQKRGWPVDTELAQVNGKSVHRVFVGPLSAADVNPYIDILGKMGINARQVTR